MSAALRVLLLEDSADDAQLMVRALERSGLTITWQRVANAAHFQTALVEHAWDMVLADYTLPAFSALGALDLVKVHAPETPFIIISGSIGEETAIAALKAGASDYLIKGSYSRLGTAVERALREAAARRERREAVTALRASEERWLFALEGSGDGVWDLDLLSNTAFFSRRCLELVGIDSVSFSMRRNAWLERIHPEDLPEQQRRFAEHLAGKTELYAAEYRIRGDDDRERWIAARGRVMTFTENGTPIRCVGTVTDISARKQAEADRARLEQQLRQSQKMEALGTLAGGIAHDFNNILAAMVGYLALLHDDLRDQPEALTLISELQHASNRARDLVRQILTFSARHEPLYQPLQLQPVIHEALRMIRAATPGTVTLHTVIDEHTSAVLADQTQIHQTVMNLVTNAIAALPNQRGEVWVGYAEMFIDSEQARNMHTITPGQYVRMCVRDTGHGMDAATMERIFEPFFTAHGPGKSTGLGLAIVHGVVTNHRGAITVASTPGHGSTFTVYLPVSAEPALTFGSLPYSAPYHTAGRVLYVDDEVHVLEPMRRILERNGYEVSAYANPDDALHTFLHAPERFDLVITDLTMPSMSGTELAQQLLHARATLPIILTTGYTGNVSEEQARQLGFCQILMKPFSTNELLAAAHAALCREHVHTSIVT